MNIQEFWRVVLAQDEKEIRKYFHKDAYINWHCTNEHFNVDEFIIANCEYPGDWDGIIERIEEMNDLIFIESDRPFIIASHFQRYDFYISCIFCKNKNFFHKTCTNVIFPH